MGWYNRKMIIEKNTGLFFVVFLGVLLVSISLHEVCHAIAAKYYGDNSASNAGRISLNPVRHVDPFLTIFFPVVFFLLTRTVPIIAAKPVPVNTMRLRGGEMAMAVVGVVGPISNLLLAIIGATIVQGLSGGLLFEIVLLFTQINVSLFVFNMLPIPPLDGSRLLYAFAPESVQRQMENIESLGILPIIMMLIILGPILEPVLTKANNIVLNLIF
jgi:Zn-dependent protease